MSDGTPKHFFLGSNGGSYIRWIINAVVVTSLFITGFWLNATFVTRKEFDAYKLKQEEIFDAYKAKQEVLRTEIAQQTREELRKITEILTRIDERNKVIKELQEEERARHK